MKLLLQLAASILLTSVCASGWPYREIVGVGQSAAPLLVAPVYGLAPATRLLPPEAEKELATVVAGPVTGTTFVEGSSSGPVTIQLPGNAVNQVENVLPPIEKASDVASVSDDSVLIKGASAGPVTLVAASDNSVVSADNAASARVATKNEAVASSASGKATVAIENTEESARNTAISETVGVASAKAVIGPSTGPIVIVGPTAPPLPTIIPPTVTPLEAATSDASISARAASTASSSASTTSTTNVASTISNSASSSASATSSASSSVNTAAPVSSSSNAASTASSSASASTASNSDSAAATAAANIAASEAESPRELNNGPSLARDATEETGAEVSTSSSTVATQNSGNSVVTASARVNFITPAATIAVDEASLSNVVVSTPTVPSAVVSVPSGSISAAAASALYLQAPL
ncbi:streptococcal hemagglutinin-like [Hylaeus anthracinus]|uniref:streptococcal hemagglutinin-like n=1 Tax=Hylaeus anthracinus TaxID=313031 RepID=UPI0023B88AA2|nr:streptococcal hemagglutinin-like [Hylaeus anthracinus]